MSAITLLGYFLLAVLIGFIWTWFALIDDKIDVIVFENEKEIEEFHKACFHGMRKGIE